MSAPKPSNVVTLLPVPPFLLELHSERMVDALHALHDAGFTVNQVKGQDNRYRIADAKGNSNGTQC